MTDDVVYLSAMEEGYTADQANAEVDPDGQASDDLDQLPARRRLRRRPPDDIQ